MNDARCLLLDEPMAGVEGRPMRRCSGSCARSPQAASRSASSSTTSPSSATSATRRVHVLGPNSGARLRRRADRRSRSSPNSISGTESGTHARDRQSDRRLWAADGAQRHLVDRWRTARGSASSATTAPARRRCCKCIVGARAPSARHVDLRRRDRSPPATSPATCARHRLRAAGPQRVSRTCRSRRT